MTTHVFHDLVRLRIHNLGTQPLVISSLAISGGDTSYFTLPNGELTTPPGPIAAGGQYDLDVKFQAGVNPTQKAKRESTLVIQSNDADESTTVVELAGYNLAQPEGNNEPSQQEILDTFGYDGRITFAGQTLNQSGFVQQVGDEILSPYWLRANTAQPVSVIQIGGFHTQGNTATLYRHNKGSNTVTSIVTMAGAEAQSFLPHRNGSTTLLSNATFTPSTPTTVFGFRVDGEWSDPTKNSQSADMTNGCPGPCGHHVRVWKVRDRQGNLVPNAYILTMDYSGINYDYNDNTYLITNIKPELTARDPAIVAAAPGNAALVLEFNQAYAGTLTDTNGETVGFPDTQHNKTDNTQPAPPTASYVPAELDINTAGAGTLTVSTNAGLNSTNDNTQVNALCLPFDGRGPAAFAVSTTLVGPLTNLNAANRQGGVMFGPTQDDFVKLIALGQSGGPVVQLSSEIDGAAATVGSNVTIPNPATVTALKLTLIGDPVAATIRGTYEIVRSAGSDGVVTLPGVVTLTGTKIHRFFDRRASGCIMTSHKNSTQTQVVFDRFAVESAPAAGGCSTATDCTGTAPICTQFACVSGACVAQNVSSGTSCANDGLTCTTDLCNGAGACVHQPGNAGAVCRASAGECDAAETCTGTSATCPADVVVGNGTPCTNDGNPCTADVCSSGSCTHAAGNAGTVCRPSIDLCDAAESCDGVSTTCPPDILAMAGTTCRTAASDCDLTETCSGSSAACPADTNKPAGTPCADDGNVCTTDACNSSGSCAHPPGNPGAICRPGGECDLAEACTGSSASCPADAFAPSTAACTSDGNVCTDDHCNGAGACAHPPNAAACNDGDACTTADQCAAGACSGTSLAGQSCDTGLLGQCAAGVSACDAGAVSCTQAVQPGPEVCGNATDEDCDGEVDDLDACGAVCTPANTFAVTDQTKRTVIAQSSAADRDKVITKGTFALPLGMPFDLDDAPVTLEIADGAGLYYTATLPASLFVASSSGRKFQFKDPLAPYENGGLQTVKLIVKGPLVKYRFKARSLNLPAFTAGTGTVTIRVSNRCYVDSSDTCTASGARGSCR